MGLNAMGGRYGPDIVVPAPQLLFVLTASTGLLMIIALVIGVQYLVSYNGARNLQRSCHRGRTVRQPAAGSIVRIG